MNSSLVKEKIRGWLGKRKRKSSSISYRFLKSDVEDQVTASLVMFPPGSISLRQVDLFLNYSHYCSTVCFPNRWRLFKVKSYIYIYIYIYIFPNLLSTSIHGYQKKTKKKKKRQEQEIKISWITARGKKTKFHRTKRKKRPTPSHQSKKNQEICNQLVKRKLKPVVNAAMPQLQECSTRVEPITKLT